MLNVFADSGLTGYWLSSPVNETKKKEKNPSPAVSSLAQVSPVSNLVT